jgi:hypothetical protein
VKSLQQIETPLAGRMREGHNGTPLTRPILPAFEPVGCDLDHTSL